MNKKYIALIGAIALLAGVIRAHAAIITLPGDTVVFTFDDTQLGLFGEPLVLDDTLYFLPTTFVAKSENAEGIRSTNQTTNVLVTAKPDRTITEALLDENGTYRRVEDFGGGPTAVGVTGQLRLLDTSNLSNVAADDIDSQTAFEPTGFLAPPENWAASAGVNVSDWESTEVNVTIQNILSAVSFEVGDLAFIEKKYVGLSVTTIPLPNALILFGFGLLSLLLTQRRRQS